VPGLTFLNTLFLAGLAAASLPVIIHLLHRRPAERVDFSWLKFIRRAQPSRTRKFRMKDLLLLLVRILLLAFLSLALARPALKGGLLGSGEGRARTSACLVIDDSFSMGARSGDERLFDRARTRALEAVSLLGSGDDAMLILGRSGSKSIVGEPTRDLAFVRRKIEALEVSARGGDVAGALGEAKRRLETSENLNKEIYFFTDSQAAGWKAPGDSRIEIGEDVSLYWVTVGALPEANVRVERVDRVETLGDGSRGPVLQAVVRNTGRGRRTSLLVELESGGEMEDQALIDLEENAAASVLLRMGEPASGPATGRVRISEDALGIDDVRYFSFSGPQVVRTVVVGGGSTVPGGRGPAFFVGKALDPMGDDSSGIRVISVRSGEMPSGEMETADVVILADVPRVELAQMDVLRRFVRRGGGLLILAGPSVDLGFYNRTLLPEFLDLSLIGPYGEGDAGGFFEIRLVRNSHPIFASLEGEASRLVNDAHFWRVMRMRAGNQASVLAEFPNVGPALVEGIGGPGRVLFFGSSGDPVWTGFPLTGGFVPLIHEAVRYLSTSGGPGIGSHAVGGSANVMLTGGGGGVVGVDPRGEELLLEPRMVEGRPRVRWDDLEIPGLYRLRWGEEEVGCFAVNVAMEESSLDIVSPEWIADRIDGERVRFIGPEDEMEKEVAMLRYGRELGSSLIWAAFALFAFESWLIRGRRTSDSAERLRKELFR